MCIGNCKGGFWIFSPKDRWIKAQRAQYNEFVESGLKTRLQWLEQHSQWIKDDKKTKTNKFCARKFFLSKVQGE